MTTVSDVSIANAALMKLGAARITSFGQGSEEARAVAARYESVRDSELRKRKWSFSLARIELAALADAPAFGFAYAYQLPEDCIRVLSVGDFSPGLDLAEIRGTLDTEDYRIEGRTVLTDQAAPLRLRYVKRVTDPAQFDSAFTEAFAARLAVELCEALTQSGSKKEAAWADYRIALREAIQANAIELPAEQIADDSWIIARVT